MLTKKEDVQNVMKINFIPKRVKEFKGDLHEACSFQDPVLIISAIDLVNRDGELLYRREEILSDALVKGREKYKDRYSQLVWALRSPFTWRKNTSKYGIRYITELGSKTPSEEFQDTRLEVQTRSAELSLRIILQKEKERFAEENPTLSDLEISRKIFENNYNSYYRSPLHLCAESGPECGDVRVIIDELGVENIPFDIGTHPDLENYEHFTPMMTAANGGNFKLFEIYLTEYFKMKYEDKENNSLYNEIVNYLTFHFNSFPDVIQMLPKNIANAMMVAASELESENGENFDPEKLKIKINEFEQKIMPDIYQQQLKDREIRFNVAKRWSFTIIGAPIVWIWYAYHRAKEPISATQTTLPVYKEYLERKIGLNAKSSSGDEISEDASLNTSDIIQRINTKEPVKKRPISKNKPRKWRTHKVIKLSENDDITVFTNRFNDQAKNFDREIKAAERLVQNRTKS